MEIEKLVENAGKVPDLEKENQLLKERLDKLAQRVDTVPSFKLVMNIDDVMAYTGFKRQTARNIMQAVGKSNIHKMPWVLLYDLNKYLMQNKNMSLDKIESAARKNMRERARNN